MGNQPGEGSGQPLVRAQGFLGATVGCCRHVWRIVVPLLCELADERPYQRYLAAHGCAPSPTTWRQFQDQRFRVKYANPRCC